MIGLVDCNNFYASCERVFKPYLKNKPIIVLSNNDGCVIARSNEAKSLGIKMGEPVFKVKALIKKNKVSVFSTNFALYGDLSHRVMKILKTEFNKLEVYSIDEAFLDFSAFKSIDRAVFIRNKIRQWTGIPVSIGIAPNKTLAKIANHIAKKHTKKGVFALNNEIIIKRALKTFPVGRFQFSDEVQLALVLSQTMVLSVAPLSVIPPPLAVVSVGVSTTANSMFLSSI